MPGQCRVYSRHWRRGGQPAAAFAKAAHHLGAPREQSVPRRTRWKPASPSVITTAPMTTTPFTLVPARRTPCAADGGFVFNLSETKFRRRARTSAAVSGVKADAYPKMRLYYGRRGCCSRPVKLACDRADAPSPATITGAIRSQAELAVTVLGKFSPSAHACMPVGSYIVSAAVAPLGYSLRYSVGLTTYRRFSAHDKGLCSPTPRRSAHRAPDGPKAIM